MSKKVWISLPLITTADATDSAVVGFTKGGQKKELEVETAAFITKWLMDRSVPFGVDFESPSVKRDAVLDMLPRRLQRILGYKASAASEAAAEEGQGETAGAADAADGDPEPAAEGQVVSAEGAPAESENPPAAGDILGND